MMHKKLMKLMLLLSLIVIFPVHAACSYKEQAELNKEVSNIKVSYEETSAVDGTGYLETGDTKEIIYHYFIVNIMNLSDNFYIKYSNNINKDQNTFYYSNAQNGVINIEWKNLANVTTMTFKVYSSSKTNCKDELYRTIYLTLPRFNTYYDWPICDGKEDLSLCDKYVTSEKVDYDEFVGRVVKALNNNSNNEDTNTNKTTNDTSNNMSNMNLYIYGGIALLAVIIMVVVIVIVNKRRNRL